MPYTVTRQLQWATGLPVVEISTGGLDYTNPDALSPKYRGEFETYADPRQAVDVAIAICRAWRKDGEKKSHIGHGNTCGMTMPFEPCSFNEAKAWARQRYRTLPKCDRCGQILGEEPWYHDLLDPDVVYCSERCAEASNE